MKNVKLNILCKGYEYKINTKNIAENIQILSFEFIRSSSPGNIKIEWTIPSYNIFFRWVPSLESNKSIPPDWSSSVNYSFTDFMPLCSFIGTENNNIFTFACNEIILPVKLKSGIVEEECSIRCSLSIDLKNFQHDSYNCEIYFDSSQNIYAEVIRRTALYLSKTNANQKIKSESFDFVYSTWYSFHQNINRKKLENSALKFPEYKLRTMIVDDGWQTSDNKRGYAFCGDWLPEKSKFPDFSEHIMSIREQGINYLLWFAPPLVGINSSAYKKFKDMILYEQKKGTVFVLDPRFPEVRKYLIDKLHVAMNKWGVSGFKLDFIDSFATPVNWQDYPDNRRDFDCVFTAVQVLLKQIRSTFPEAIIEFRQKYIAPILLGYGDIIRAADCPGDILSNRIRTIELRLCCPNCAVHSDMLKWHFDLSTESAALQLLNVFFAVPQISVDLTKLPEAHQKMLSFYLTFIDNHSETLFWGKLLPLHPELNYPQVIARGEGEIISVIYQTAQIVQQRPGIENFILNACDCNGIYVEFMDKGEADIFDCYGNLHEKISIVPGIQRVAIPIAGILHFESK
ncbi:MAG: alpha-galactosidase [Victivallales bacterium]|nr:alpha-galactosidase [Victivallales bacterium]